MSDNISLSQQLHSSRSAQMSDSISLRQQIVISIDVGTVRSSLLGGIAYIIALVHNGLCLSSGRKYGGFSLWVRF